MRKRLPAVLVVLCATAAVPVRGQVDFLATARSGTERYRDMAVALADGYRTVGPDFPSMGVHCVNTGLLVGGVLDPAHPTVLEYATIAGRPTLVGVAYAVLVSDTTPPAGLPVPPSAWHTHAGTVDDESFVLSHAQAALHQRGAVDGPKVAILHAWIWLDNPAGLFATDNWALPFARLGYAAPESVTADAGRGMALAAGGLEYFRTLVRVTAHPDAAEAERLDALLEAAAGDVARAIGVGSGHTLLSHDQVVYLGAAWRRAWRALLQAASPPVRTRLAAL